MFALLLAALLHVLACAHGPAVGAAERIDAFPRTPSAPVAAVAGTPSSFDADPDGHDGAHCCPGSGEAALQAPRRHKDLASPPLHVVPQADDPGAPTGVGPAQRRGSPFPAGASSDGPSRALLGVWRS
ncbi:hypothetical protein [Streptomyces sp. NPDC002676]